MKKSVKLTLLIAPYLILGLLTGTLMIWGTNPDFFAGTTALYACLLLILLMLLLYVRYVILVARADSMETGVKTAWILAILFVTWLAVPVFWYFNWNKF